MQPIAQPILLIDDDPLAHESLRLLLGEKCDNGCSLASQLEYTSDVDEALRRLKACPDGYALVLLDYHQAGHDPEKLCRQVRSAAPDLYLVIYSGDKSREAVKAAMRAGADDFLDKGSDPCEIQMTIAGYVECRRKEILLRENSSTVSRSPEEAELGMVIRSPAMRALAQKMIQHRSHRFNVLIIGESGTGKERVAKAIHGRDDARFFAVNCASYRDNSQLLETELFGYEKGAFTGADRPKAGLIESARDGTVFLDEIHELSIAAQAKLLRVLQERKIRRVGGTRELPFEARILAAAKPTIFAKRDQGEFLLDLFNRLYVFPLEIPPLRERKEEIPALVEFFVKKYAKELGKSVVATDTLIEQFKEYLWPGNIRELENAVLRWVAEGAIQLSSVENAGTGKTSESNAENSAASLTELKERFECEEKAQILKVLEKTGFHLRNSAKTLGVSHTTLFGKIRKYQIHLEKHT